jgi:hypothetical protein
MNKSSCAGLKVITSSLEPNRMEVVRSVVDRGPYGQIEDWNGRITVEVTVACHMSEEACRIVAEALAQDELETCVYVEAWNYERVGSLIHLTPKEWIEYDPESHMRYVK